MSVTAAGADRFAPSAPSLLRRLIAGPRQGWLAVVLLGVMLAVVGLAIDDARYVGDSPAGQSQTWWLPLALVAAGAVGFLLGVSRISTAGAHLVSVAVAAPFVLVAAAGSVSDAATLLGRLRELSESFGTYVNDVFVIGAHSTETSGFLLMIGAICWTTGYFAAFNVFRRNRGVPAVVSVGLALLVNISITLHNQYGYLIVFTLAAMLLLVRLNIVEQSVGWQRRHIGNADNVAALFLRGGALFVTVALIGATFLAATASSAPLAGVWTNMTAQLVSVTDQFNRLMGGVTGPTNQVGGLFGPVQPVRESWESSETPLFIATTDDPSQYWRGATFDAFTGTTWIASDLAAQDVGAGGSLVADSVEDLALSAPNRERVSGTITWLGTAGNTLLAPDTPTSASLDTRTMTAGGGGPLELITLRDAIQEGESYSFTSLVPDFGSDGSGLTASMLAAAGTDYPDWTKRYLDYSPSSIGPITSNTAQSIRNKLRSDQRDPYHVAHAIQSYFSTSNGFQYKTDVTGLCSGGSIVDCLLTKKQGFCQYYASAMTMMLRTLHIPARFVQGFLPGQELPDGGGYVIKNSATHAWVEVFFPGYGWIRFDPTPGNALNGRVGTDLPAGQPVAASPAPSASPEETAPVATEPPDQTTTQVPPVSPPANPGTIGLMVAFALVLLAIVLGLLARRRLGHGMTGDQTFDRVTRLATRLGYAPRPSQTAYEYAGTLADVVPGLRPELQVVANAKVEAIYARRLPSRASIAALQHAYARIRRGLVSLMLRPRRPKPSRKV